MLPFLILGLYWISRRARPQWSSWILRVAVVVCLVAPQWGTREMNFPILAALLAGASLGYWYRDAKSI
jgi:hypothetical protein